MTKHKQNTGDKQKTGRPAHLLRPAKTGRALGLVLAAGLLGGAVLLILNALEDSVVFFYGPAELSNDADIRAMAMTRTTRLGGLVEPGSLKKMNTNASSTTHFVITDGVTTMPVSTKAPLPDLFREGQGVVVEGKLTENGFDAELVLAKHDETYMPPEVAETLKKQGVWRHNAEDEEPTRKAPAGGQQ